MSACTKTTGDFMLVNREPGRVDSLECDHKGDFRDRLRKDVGLPGIALLRTSVFHVETIVVVAARVLWRPWREAYDSEATRPRPLNKRGYHAELF